MDFDSAVFVTPTTPEGAAILGSVDWIAIQNMTGLTWSDITRIQEDWERGIARDVLLAELFGDGKANFITHLPVE